VIHGQVTGVSRTGDEVVETRERDEVVDVEVTVPAGFEGTFGWINARDRFFPAMPPGVGTMPVPFGNGDYVDFAVEVGGRVVRSDGSATVTQQDGELPASRAEGVALTKPYHRALELTFDLGGGRSVPVRLSADVFRRGNGLAVVQASDLPGALPALDAGPSDAGLAPATPPAPAKRRAPWLWIGLGAGLLVLIAVLAVVLRRRR